MENNISAWLIIAHTNLHIGNESINNFGVIDQAIQRDPLTKLPCINSSSLKGAIKEFVAMNVKDISCKKIFGSEKNAKADAETQKGSATFFDANLLFLPIQSTDGQSLYKMVFQTAILENFSKKLSLFGLTVSADRIKEIVSSQITAPFMEVADLEVYSNDENLPIIARNELDNGESVNLWYEQVLPPKSVLGTLIIAKDNQLEDALDGKLIQIGANATIGYGFCSFIKLTQTNKNE